MEKLNIDVKLFSEYVINFIHDINEYNFNTDDEKQISPLKLQKLLYFVYVYALTTWNKKLWNDNFERWDYGPVISKIYFQYSKYANNTIDRINKNIKLEMLTNIEKLELEALMLEINEKFNPFELSKISHSFPWENAQYNKKITDKDIKNYYSKTNLSDRFISEIIKKPSLENDFKFLD